jgi:uncharacterized protein
MGQDAIDAINRFREGLAQSGISDARVILYGSHAHGSPHVDSDIDVVVISTAFSGRSFWDRFELIAPAVWGTHAPIEAVPMTPDEWSSRQSVIVDYAADGIEV